MRNLASYLRWQGLPADFLAAEAPFTVAGKVRVVGNGVPPLPMGRAIAQAVRRAVAPLSCPTAKVPYATATAAFKEMQGVRARRKKRGAKEQHGSVGVEVYKCACGAWHLGRASGAAKKGAKNA